MADFVAVLRKTLEGLGDTTPELRARVYQKARATVESKLAAINPPPPPAVAERQRASLEEAVVALEAEYSHPLRRAPDADPLAELENVFASIGKTGRENERLIRKPPSRRRSVQTLDPAEVKLATAPPKPPEPTLAEGPHFGLRRGKLISVAHPPKLSEAKLQDRLHTQIRNVAADTELASQRVQNKFPELVGAVVEYSRLLKADISEIDVVSLWAVGGALYSFVDAYREQNIAQTIGEPLEPQTAALLQNLSRLHGAFIMGFEEGRDLVQKADNFRLGPKVLETIEAAGAELIDVFVNNTKLVDIETRNVHRPVRDYVHEFGWGTSRVGFAAYVVVRNGVYSCIKLTVGDDITPNAVFSAALVGSTLAGDPNADFVRNVLPVFQQQSANMLAFFAHSPEFRAYIEWALTVLKLDAAATK